jgi:3-deoxy-manno-octulosonate cytidylyltransferase (CMP-KDO synthetase)
MSADPSVLIVVPARLASTRFPGKPLTPLRGRDGVTKPLVQWSWEAASRAADVAQIVVATDAPAIAQVVEDFGGRVVMTSPECRNGTERAAEALASIDLEPDLVINLQGDSPLVRRSDVLALIHAWRETGAAVLTPYVQCDRATEERLVSDMRAGRIGGTTVVTDRTGRALYFSKRLIPYQSAPGVALKLHIGLYAYTPQALGLYAASEPAPLEQAEGLEQLRFLENGLQIQTVEIPDLPSGFWEVNNPEDVEMVERALRGAT